MPKTAGHGKNPFYPQSLERGQQSSWAVMLAVAEMYIKGVSTRQAEDVMREFGHRSGANERRHVLGLSVALSEAEVHWRAFLESLLARGMHGTTFIVSDDHAGLKAARRAVFGAATWQRCQFHLAQNAVQHAPKSDIKKRIGKQLRAVWNASSLQRAKPEISGLQAGEDLKTPTIETSDL